MTDSNIAGIAEADFGKAGVSFDNDRPILVDSSDFLFYAALAMLPIDGTSSRPIHAVLDAAFSVVVYGICGSELAFAAARFGTVSAHSSCFRCC